MIAALLASPASARCIGSSDPLVHRMELAIGRDPAAAIERIDKAIAGTAPASRRLAELYIAKSQALAMSGSTDKLPLDRVRSIGGVFGPADNIGIYLRITDAADKTDSTEMAKALQAIASDAEALPDGSRARTCRLTDLAYHNSMIEHSRDAMRFATQAYRNADGHADSLERSKATSMLAILVSGGHDFDYAAKLHSEAFTIQQDLGLSDLASNELLLRGYTRLDRGDWKPALEDFEASAREARSYGNAYAVDFALLGLCEAALEGDMIERAAPACERAYEGLNRLDDGMGFPATTLMARLLVKSGKPARALQLLDPLIAEGRGSEATTVWVMALQTRAQALSLLGRDAQAYAALREASTDAEDLYDRELQSGVAVLQARFQTEELQRRLAAEERASGARLRLAIAVTAGSATTLVMLGMLIFVLLRHRRKFRHLAMTDPLTGLANRRATLEQVDEVLRNVGPSQPRASMALFDIDHFKACNDTYGHDAGDRVLTEFARIVEGCVRPTDIVGRWGGEEFLAIFPATHAQEAAIIVDRIRVRAAREPFDFAPDYRLEFSAGIAMLHETDDRLDACIKLADKRLYAAKAQGRDRTCLAGGEGDTGSSAKTPAKTDEPVQATPAARAA